MDSSVSKQIGWSHTRIDNDCVPNVENSCPSGRQLKKKQNKKSYKLKKHQYTQMQSTNDQNELKKGDLIDFLYEGFWFPGILIAPPKYSTRAEAKPPWSSKSTVYADAFSARGEHQHEYLQYPQSNCEWRSPNGYDQIDASHARCQLDPKWYGLGRLSFVVYSDVERDDPSFLESLFSLNEDFDSIRFWLVKRSLFVSVHCIVGVDGESVNGIHEKEEEQESNEIIRQGIRKTTGWVKRWAERCQPSSLSYLRHRTPKWLPSCINGDISTLHDAEWVTKMFMRGRSDYCDQGYINRYGTYKMEEIPNVQRYRLTMKFAIRSNMPLDHANKCSPNILPFRFLVSKLFPQNEQLRYIESMSPGNEEINYFKRNGLSPAEFLNSVVIDENAQRKHSNCFARSSYLPGAKLSDVVESFSSSSLCSFGLKVQLNDYQIQSLQFMLHQELHSQCSDAIWAQLVPGKVWFSSTHNRFSFVKPYESHGGIVADSMGLGKTLVALACICTNPLEKQKPSTSFNNKYIERCEETSDSDSNDFHIDLSNDEDHCANANQKPMPPSVFDFPADEPEPILLRHSIGTPASDYWVKSKATLIVCPASIFAQWTEEIKRHAQVPLQIAHYYGPKRAKRTKDLCNVDIVLTTYQILTMEYSRIQCERYAQPWENWGPWSPLALPLLHRIHFHRIILDESHVIRNRQAMVTRSALHLSATYKWSFSATPILTNLGDLESQLEFLGVSPLEPHFWDFIRKHSLNLSSATARQVQVNDLAIQYNHGFMSNTLIQQSRRCWRILCTLFSALTIRHIAKQPFAGRQQLLQLPPLTTQYIRLPFDSDQLELYNRMLDHAKKRLDNLAQLPPSMRPWMHQIQVWLPLRQVCSYNHILIHELEARMSAELQYDEQQIRTHRESLNRSVHSSYNQPKHALTPWKVEDFQIAKTVAFQERDADCPICLSAPVDPIQSLCGHVFCIQCMEILAKPVWKTKCPICREVLTPKGDFFRPKFATKPQTSPSPEAESASTEKDECENKDVGLGELEQWQNVPNILRDEILIDIDDAEITSHEIYNSNSNSGSNIAMSDANSDSNNSNTKRPREMNDNNQLNLVNQSNKRPKLVAEEIKMNESEAKSSCLFNNKVKYVVREIQQLRDRNQQQHTSEKVVIFTQYENTIKHLKQSFSAQGIVFSSLEGSMPVPQRKIQLEKFANNSKCCVLILSFRAGSVGLNLTMAHTAYIMDISPNTALEDQAIARLMRLGQKNPVKIKYLIYQDSIEPNMALINALQRLGCYHSTATASEIQTRMVRDAIHGFTNPSIRILNEQQKNNVLQQNDDESKPIPFIQISQPLRIPAQYVQVRVENKVSKNSLLLEFA